MKSLISFIVFCLISSIMLGVYFWAGKMARRKMPEESNSTQSRPSGELYHVRPPDAARPNLSLLLVILYFLILLGGMYLAWFFIEVLDAPVRHLSLIICVLSLTALHLYLSIKMITTHRVAQTARKSSGTGLYSQARSRFIRAILYFITFWSCIALSIIIINYWLIEYLIPSPELVGHAVGQLLEKFVKLIPLKE